MLRATACSWFLLSVFAFGQGNLCDTCTLDFKAPIGYYGSNFCIPRNRCGNPPSREPFLKSESPGILPEQRAGKLLVRRVIYNSPAEYAGVQPGDEILSINGRLVGTGTCNAGWSASDHTSTIVLRRREHLIMLQIPSSPLFSMIRSENLVASSTLAPPSFDFSAPFIFGFRWKEQIGYIEVLQVLAGSPAEGAGLKSGGRIISLNGELLAAANAVDISELRDGGLPKLIEIETIDGAVRRRISLRSRGIAEIVATPEHRNPIPRAESADLDALPVPTAVR